MIPLLVLVVVILALLVLRRVRWPQEDELLDIAVATRFFHAHPELNRWQRAELWRLALGRDRYMTHAPTSVQEWERLYDRYLMMKGAGS